MEKEIKSTCHEIRGLGTKIVRFGLRVCGCLKAVEEMEATIVFRGHLRVLLIKGQ